MEIDTQAREWVGKVLNEIDMDCGFTPPQWRWMTWMKCAKLSGDKINLVGYSYGATAAQYYLRQHEAHVRTMALGGGSLLDVPVELWAHNSQRALDMIFDRCRAY